MNASYAYPTSASVDEQELAYNPIVPITLGHAKFSGPLEILCKVNDLLQAFSEIDSLYYEQYYRDCYEEIRQEQIVISMIYPELRNRLTNLCSPVQLQYIDTLVFHISQPIEGPTTPEYPDTDKSCSD